MTENKIDNETRVVGVYRRSTNGEVIHLDPCPHAGKAMVWHYAAEMSLHEVVEHVHATGWLRLCKGCWPKAAHAEAQS